MSARTLKTAMGVLAGTVVAASLAFPATAPKFSGSIVGMVSDALGVPQMGASVLLYNRFDQLVQRVLTGENGAFGFNSLPPETYTVRVSLASFLPALKRNIVVQPGMQSLLNVNLASVFSSIELVAVSPGQRSIMSDEWRWVLRSSNSTRPVLRILPGSKNPQERKSASVFSDTRGVVKLSAGDQAAESAFGSEPDLGTAFALATSFLGQNQLHVSGNIGYVSVSGAPTAAFRTSFRHSAPEGGSGPEVKLTMRQVSLPRLSAPVPAGLQDSESAPVLRTLSVTALDQKQITDNLRFEYGASLDSVTFLDRLNYVSPYARLTYDRGRGAVFQFGYASGTPPAEAFIEDGENDVELQQDLAALALFPRVSLRSGAARVQRTQTVEAGYRKTVGSRTYSVAAYNDSVSNAAVTLVGPAEASPDLLPDITTSGWTLNAGSFHSLGYMASVSQDLGSHFDVALAYGSGGALTADRSLVQTGTPDELRAALRTSRRQSVTVRTSGTLPRTGTQFVASYQWASVLALNPAHMYLTGRMREGLGLNIRVRQPIPYFGGLPGHLEATAEVRNLLAQGYTQLPRRLYLLQTPRSLRGGVSFSF
jgi:hypothetical protein